MYLEPVNPPLSPIPTEHGLSYAILLRRELSERNQAFARKYGLPHHLSYGAVPTVAYEPFENGTRHGNFLDVSYRAILADREWSRRLTKAHSQARRSLPRNDRGFWCELDSCNSSDALLMNVFCYPGTLRSNAVRAMIGCEQECASHLATVHAHDKQSVAPTHDALSRSSQSSIPDSRSPSFGVRARVPLLGAKQDATEIDMRLGSLLVEAKLTESDFQCKKRDVVERYRDLHEVFDTRMLPKRGDIFVSYQLIRNVLAAYAMDCSFCVIMDARRHDLMQAWYDVLRSVKSADLRVRLKALTWQELAQRLPTTLRRFLDEKYGIA
jgi:hypothetical protein